MLALSQVIAWVYVELPDGLDSSKLEFALHAAEHRRGHEYGFYARALSDMVNSDLRAKFGPSVGVSEEQSYGHEQLALSMPSADMLPAVLECAGAAVARWVARFNARRIVRSA